MAGRRPLTDEQKQRKNEKAKELRLKKKLDKASGELKELEATKLPEPEIIENIEDPDEVQRKKMETLERRKRALEIARSKRVSPTQIRKNNEEEVMRLKQEKEEEVMRLKQEKEQEVMRMKEENDKLKSQRDASIIDGLKAIAEEKPKIPKAPKVKIIRQYINPPKKKKNEIVPQTPQTPQIDYLAQQTYAEQLKAQFNKMLMNKISADTFG